MTAGAERGNVSVMGLQGRGVETMTLGVEEEFLVVDGVSGALVPRAGQLTPHAKLRLGDDVTSELNLCQIEVATPVCHTLDDLAHHLTRLRHQLATAAEEIGCRVLAAGTHPFSRWQDQEVDTSHDRYRRMVEDYQILAREQVICGCHVHVGIDDRDQRLAVMTRSRPWLPAILALSANSPFWQGADTGYASFRLQVWQRWPTCGMPPPLSSWAEFEALVKQLEAIDAVEDATFLYWYVRPSLRFPTLEFRAGDVCLSLDDTVAIAGLVRALAWTSATMMGAPAPQGRQREVLDAAMWRASRYGLEESLVSPVQSAARPAAQVVDELLEHVRDGLEAHGDFDRVSESVAAIMARGNGATRQRRAFDRSHSGRDVLDYILEESAPVATRRR